ncbi:Nuclear nucleic acid-binding protein C1D [Dirofilaria immitis]
MLRPSLRRFSIGFEVTQPGSEVFVVRINNEQRYDTTRKNIQRPPLEKLEIDLMSVFVINSLYWMLLCTHGQKPRDNELLQNEINRTKEYMGRLKQLEERKTAPCLNQRAARSFVRNALWEPKQKQRSDTSDDHTNKNDERFKMESDEDESISLEESKTSEDQMEEEDDTLVNLPTMKSAVKRSPQEANIMMTGGIPPKKKRL